MTNSHPLFVPPAPGEPRIPVAVLGATGSVGQRFVSLLADHPWFRLAEPTASERSAGRPYGEAARWMQAEPLDPGIAALEVLATDPVSTPLQSRLVFSALDSKTAARVEAAYAANGHVVVTNASHHRMDADVPLMVPEVNPDHLGLLATQAHGDGALLANPNCSTIGLVMALRPLHDAFGIEAVHVVTMQALSGAGIPGVPSLAALDNLVPFIGGEEDKLETEVAKILGSRSDAGAIIPADIPVSAACNRVAVIDGHTACVSLRLSRPATPEQAAEVMAAWRAEPQRLGLPSAPERPIHVLSEIDRPQPRLDRDRDRGMAASVGRLRTDPLFDLKFVVLSHNTLRGAAGGAILVAELALARGAISIRG